MISSKSSNVVKSILNLRVQRFGGLYADLDPLKHITMKRYAGYVYEDSVAIGEYPLPDRFLVSDDSLTYYWRSKELLLQYIESNKV